MKNSVVNSSVENGGVFGMKMHWWQLEDFLVMARHAIGIKSAMDLSDRAVLERFFPGLKFVYLQREDGVAQAVSAAIASQSGEWEKREFAEKVRPRVIKFHPWKIYEWESLIKEQNQAWETFFAESGIVPYRLTYERLTSSFSQEVSQVLSYLALPEASSKPDQPRHFDMPVKRQSTVANQRLITAYKTLPRSVSALSLWLYRQLKPLPPSPVLSLKSLEGGAE